MAASFASRLSGLREKKITQTQNQQGQLRLTLPPDASERSSYQPSTSFSNTRTSFRLLKGRIDRGQSTEKQEQTSSTNINEPKGLLSTQKMALIQQPIVDLKLKLSDQPYVEEKKTISQPPKIPIQKRILIAKQLPKEEVKREEPPKREEPKKEDPPPQKIEKQGSRQFINPHEQKPIREEEAQQSLPAESQNDLVMCPEGCGRKFNRKALQKHAKACKLVFMSKRKEFNSEAKRIVSKEQATIVKQTKIEEKKKMGMTRGKGFDKTKTGENWKAASEDFRAAIKAIKNDEKGEKNEEGQEGQEVEPGDNIEQKKVINVLCQYCEKQFNEVFIEKHVENCTKKREKEREKDKKKSTKK